MSTCLKARNFSGTFPFHGLRSRLLPKLPRGEFGLEYAAVCLRREGRAMADVPVKCFTESRSCHSKVIRDRRFCYRSKAWSLRLLLSDVTELNWHGFVFDELTSRQVVIIHNSGYRLTKSVTMWLRARTGQPIGSPCSRVSSVQFSYVALFAYLSKYVISFCKPTVILCVCHFYFFIVSCPSWRRHYC